MEWNILIPMIPAVVTGVLSYLAAISKSKSVIKSNKIIADNEIKKIRESADGEIRRVKETADVENQRLKEQYKHDLEKLQKETDERIRLMVAEKEIESKSKSDEMATKFAEQFFTNPKSMNLEGLGESMSGLVQLKRQMEILGFMPEEKEL
ncbi:hypothetical protein [Listeria cornellensis]|uniref:Uncharacterized protein n=1 Tax=Listeria cornellensis FSL F6-0969 TaxID=1265820 RepID=W7C4R2_9LIST|nr:hypothetical protein [Listeria cornellensis]EUJ32210.1 hypothetical protein PCORN_02506 [Listeria cornellensis FSL F6-0969]